MLLNDKIRQLRIERNWSLRELAKKSNISSFSYIANIEKGVVEDPGIKTVIKLANAFNVSIDELVGNRTKR